MYPTPTPAPTPAAVASHHALASQQPHAVPLRKPCPAGCERYGNCNIEDGRCECPWARTGPACEVHQVPACRLSDAPDALCWCSDWYPKSCECFRWATCLRCLRLQAVC